MSDQPVTETSTYTGQHNTETQGTNIHAPCGIQTRDPSNRAAADLRLRPRGHWDRRMNITGLQKFRYELHCNNGELL
jgi:hypothetical protein